MIEINIRGSLAEKVPWDKEVVGNVRVPDRGTQL